MEASPPKEFALSGSIEPLFLFRNLGKSGNFSFLYRGDF